MPSGTGIFAFNVRLLSAYGTTSYIRYNDYAYGDFSIITANNNVVLTNKVLYSSSSSGYQSITGTVADPAEGSLIFYHGARSGATYLCQVTNTLKTIYMDNSVHVKGLTEASITTIGGVDEGGNSGAPYYTVSSGTWKIGGIHSGHGNHLENGVTVQDYTTVYFTPWKYISMWFTPKLS